MEMLLVKVKITLACIAILIVSNLQADDSPNEYKIMASYLYNLVRFIHWPESHTTRVTPNICIYGNTHLYEPLEALTQRITNKQKMAVIRVNSTFNISVCDIVFVSKQINEMSAILKKTALYSILTVGESTRFLDSGGIIGLIVEHNKDIQLNINLTHAKKMGFEISGNLLEIANSIQ